MTKGSLLAPPGKDHIHCNLAALTIFKGGAIRPYEDVDAVLDRMDYLMQTVQAGPMARGPRHRDTRLN